MSGMHTLLLNKAKYKDELHSLLKLVSCSLDDCATSTMPILNNTFVRAHINLGFGLDTQEGVNSLPELVEFNAKHNPDHLFGVQLGSCQTSSGRRITFAELSLAVERTAGWLVRSGVTTGRSSRTDEVAPVAILLGSDVGIFIYILALLRIGTPVLLLSARLTPVAIVHLVKATGPSTVLTSSQVARSVKETILLLDDLPSKPRFVQALTADDFFDGTHCELQDMKVPPVYRDFHYNDRDAIIMHSSGTTGLPKPIYHAHAYPLVVASGHRLPEQKAPMHFNASTLPLYHGFGLGAPCLALSIGLPFVLLAAITIPTARSTLKQLESSNARSLFTVPSIIEDLLHEGDRAIEALQRLEFVAVGGAAIGEKVLRELMAHDIKLLNHWGATEFGPIAPIERPPPGYDARYLMPRTDTGLEFRPVEGSSQHFQLSGRPAGWDEELVVQDLLERHPRDASQYRILGRVDDLIVLGTGEKVRPTSIETAVKEHPDVRAAIAFGDGMDSLGVIVELAGADRGVARADVLTSLEPYLIRGNTYMDKHAKVSREMLVLTYAETKPLQRTDKGSLSRKVIFAAFECEIKDAYARVDAAAAAPLPSQDGPCALRHALRGIVGEALHLDSLGDLNDAADFFEAGMDSLQATRLRQVLLNSLRVTPNLPHPVDDLPRELIYENSSVNALFAFVERTMDGRAATAEHDAEKERLEAMRALVEKHTAELQSFDDDALNARTARGQSTPKEHDEKVVLITGASGSLGCLLLERLATDPSVNQVICLNRGGLEARQRQMDAMKERGAILDDDVWRNKVTVFGCDTSKPYFGLQAELYAELLSVTHIIHNAWPVNFNRIVTSFDASITALDNLVHLALFSATRNASDHRPRRILFASSIAVAGRYPLLNPGAGAVPETPLEAYMTGAFGYPEAKWVGEQTMLAANKLFGGGEQPLIEASSVRIGQMTGPEGSGAWNASEHFPIIVATSQKLKAVPELEGTLSWMPVNRAANALVDLLFAKDFAPVFHMENPARQTWSSVLKDLSALLGGAASVPYAEWLERVHALGNDPQENPASKLFEFLERDFLHMSSGLVALGTVRACSVSQTMSSSGPIERRHLEEYVHYWKSTGAMEA
ncbi:acetyl-CoA synthetase-like protein [Peniophora sp. CONT]|nr:acetyl-CoA synthetase-like protein [Peniophora sp. CONT]